MKKILVVALLLLSFSSFSQQYKDSVKKQFNNYLDLLVKKDFKNAIIYTNEDVFKIMSKEQLLSLIESEFNDPEMEYKFGFSNITEPSDTIKIGKTFYSLLQYDNSIKIRFIETDSAGQSSEAKIETSKILLPIFQQSFEKSTVTYNKKTDMYEINGPKKVIASSYNLKDWEFTLYEKKQVEFMKQFIPEKILSMCEKDTK